jgi:hypothetical protein
MKPVSGEAAILGYRSQFGCDHVALRRACYRSDNRYIVFQSLPHTAGMAAVKWRILAKAHERRNLAEYEGHMERDDRLLAEIITTANELRRIVSSSSECGFR